MGDGFCIEISLRFDYDCGKEIFMEEYLSILRSAQLFSGVTEAELLSMLTCLDAKTESYPKGSFLLRAGDRTESV